MNQPRTGLEIGFLGGVLPQEFAHLRARVWREEPIATSYPYEDQQFEVVILSEDAISEDTVKEAHRLLLNGGRLYFSVREKTKKQDGYTAVELYNDFLKYGFDILTLTRSSWWKRIHGERRISVVASKKKWREIKMMNRATNVPFQFGNR